MRTSNTTYYLAMPRHCTVLSHRSKIHLQGNFLKRSTRNLFTRSDFRILQNQQGMTIKDAYKRLLSRDALKLR